MVDLGNKLIFAATFLSKLAFGVLFAVACSFIQSDIVNHGLEDAIKICGGEDWYEFGKRYYDEESSAWVGYEPWDEKVVECLYNVRGGLLTAGAVFLLLSIILEAKPLLKSDGKFSLVMFLLNVISGVLIFGAVISEMDIMKRMKSTTSKIFKTDDFEALFFIDYPGMSSTMWIVGFVFLLLGQLYTLFQHRHSGVLVLSTYTVAGIGSILLLIAVIPRLDIGGRVYLSSQEYHSGEIVDQLFLLDTKLINDVCVLMLSGSVFFIAHAIMFFLFLYDEAVLANEEESLSHDEIVVEQGQNANAPFDADKKDGEDELNAEIVVEQGQNANAPFDADKKDGKDELNA
ncbi:predicted protein [Chaetoceros tenuissimus]|uniref:Uncharacterized protein n=1 Tax=Chaetoceros tenuissimus TaxID=426638 RepID=A0AAD3H7B9_9STRA|nr:predicted protein [Chaetoceros tenuissimus]